jgi:hypothetical protein
MTHFVAIVTTVRGSAAAVAALDPGWLNRVGLSVAQYWSEMSGGRETVTWEVHAPEELQMTQREKDQLSAADLVNAIRAEAAANNRGLAEGDHLVAVMNDPNSGLGVTETDPVVAAKDLTAALVAHEMGHFYQHRNGRAGSEANTLPGFLTQEYGDPTCIMGAEGGKYSYVDVGLQLKQPMPGRDVAGPAMSPPMTDSTGWLDVGLAQAVVDVTGLVPCGVPLSAWSGAPRPGYVGNPVVIIGRGFAPENDQLYLSLRVPHGWDSGFPTDAHGAGTLVMQEMTSSGGPLLLGNCLATAGSSIRSGRSTLRVEVAAAEVDQVRLRLTTSPWRNWKTLTGASFASGSRIAAVSRSGMIEVFLIGLDGLVRSITFQSGMWGQWGVVAGPMFNPSAGIAAATTDPGSIDLYVVGPDDQIRQHRLRNGGWEADWPIIDGGDLDQQSCLASVATGGNTIALFATDKGDRILQTSLVGGQRGNWQPLPETPLARWAKSIAVNRLEDRTLQVHAITRSHLDDKVWTLTSHNEVWDTTWVPHGPQTFPVTVGVAAVSREPGRALVTVANTPLLAHDYAAGAWVRPWSEVEGLPLAVDSNLAAVARNSDTVEVLAVGADHQVHVITVSDDPDALVADRQVLRSYPAALISAMERFVSAQPDGGIRADRLILGGWEQFVIHELQDLSGGAGTAMLVAVQSHTGQFLCAESGGGRELVANRSIVGNWEMFKMLPSPINPNKRVLQALGGHYWCATGGGDAGVDCTRIHADAWESFVLVKL